jgi:hypothetical protein
MKSLFNNKLFYFAAAAIVTLTTTSVIFATPPATKYSRGETLDPSCAPGDANCTVDTDETDPTVKLFAKTTLPTCSVWQVLKWNGTSLSCVADSTGSGGITTETDPIFSLSQAYNITSMMLANWNAAFGWWDHHTAGYLTGEIDPTVNALAKANLSCSASQIAQYDGTTWVCATQGAGADNLWNHIATTNLQLGSNWLSGDGWSEGVFVSSTGSVWIWTSNPASSLHVLGNPSLLTNIGSWAPLLAFWWADNNLYHRIRSAWSDNGNIIFELKNPSTHYMYFNSAIKTGSGATVWYWTTQTAPTNGLLVNWNVGIGTASPTSKLDVVGGRSFFAPASEQYGVGVKYATTWGAVYFWATSNSATPDAAISNAGGATLMTLTNSGNVGIGTSTPSQKLEVVGTIIWWWSTATNGSLGFGIRYSGLDIINTFWSAYSSAATTIWYNIKSQNGSAWFVSSNWLGGTRGAISITDEFTFSNASSSTTPIWTAITMVDRFRIDNTWNVWIWTTSPDAKLTILGNYNSILNVYRNADVTAVGAAGVDIQLWALSGATKTPAASIVGQLNNPATTGELSFYTRNAGVLTEKVRVKSDWSVGIGTIAPERTLDVRGIFQIKSGSSMFLFSGGSDNTNYGTFRKADGSTNLAYIGGAAGAALSGGTANDFAITNAAGWNIFLYSASVGIGTTSPVAKLDVVWDIKVWNSWSTCTSTNAGAIRYNAWTSKHEGCNGSVWNALY